jgi:hypothetical protein
MRGWKKTLLARHQCAGGVQGAHGQAHGVVQVEQALLEKGADGQAGVGLANGFPEFGQALDPLFRRVAGDNGNIQRADRNARHAVRRYPRFAEPLEYPRLVGAQGAAALQDQCNGFVGRKIDDAPVGGAYFARTPVRAAWVLCTRGGRFGAVV